MNYQYFGPGGVSPPREVGVAAATAPTDAQGRQLVAAVSVSGAGTEQTGLPPGRSAAASSVPVVVSTEDKAALNGTFRRAAAVGATAGDALWVQGVTTAGTITVTLVNGGSLTVNVALGSTQLPFGATAAALGTAVGGTFQSLFFT